jgi:hypothetical protein
MSLVVHINREHEEIVSSAAVVVTGIRLTRGETLVLVPFVKRLVQEPRRLLETVEGLPQKKDLVCWNIATFRWREVDCSTRVPLRKAALMWTVIDQKDEDPDGVSVGNLCK